MKPGTTIASPFAITRVSEPCALATVALSPTATIVSLLMATAWAHGLAESPVHTPPRESPPPTMPSTASFALSAKLREPADRFQLLQSAAAGGSRGNGEEIADIEKNFQHQLVTHVAAF